jgi:hypothetical protein
MEDLFCDLNGLSELVRAGRQIADVVRLESLSGANSCRRKTVGKLALAQRKKNAGRWKISFC